jgi:superfamily II DNA or RNA helicase
MQYTLRVENVYSWLITDDEHTRKNLYLALRVRGKNYWHSTAFKRKIWDGWIEFFNPKSGKFLTGLLPEIVASLKTWGKPVVFDDQRTRPKWRYPTIDSNFLDPFTPKGEKKIVLHDYQVDFVNQAMKFGRGLVTSPTASGKSFTLMSLIKCLPPKTPVLFLTKQSSLVNQNYNDMLKWGVEGLGRYYDGHKEPNYVMCCTIHKSTFAGIAKLLPHFRMLVVDEVHEAMSDVPTEAFKRMKNAVYRFGFSATPFKFGGKDLEHKFKVKGHFGGILKTKTTEDGLLKTKDLQKRGILSASRGTIYPITQPDNIAHEPYQDAVTLGIANNLYFHNTVVRLANSMKGRTLVLVERIDQGVALKQLLGDKAHWISGRDGLTLREEVFQDLKHGGDVVAICMQQIITAGINVFLHNLINAAGGKAEHSTIQRMGRGLRCAPDKDVLDYYDFLFTTNDYLQDHSFVRIKTLEEEGHQVTIKTELDF